MNKAILISALSASVLLAGVTVSPSALAQRYYGSHLCGYPDFTCVKVKRGDTWERLFPNERDREIVRRLNRTNMKVTYRSWIVVPKNLKHINNMELSPFPLHKDTNGHKLL